MDSINVGINVTNNKMRKTKVFMYKSLYMENIFLCFNL